MKSKEQDNNGSRWFSSISLLRRNLSFVEKDFIVLGLALAIFVGGWFGVTSGSNVFVTGSFYSKGYLARYALSGTVSESLGARTAEIRVSKEDNDNALLIVKLLGKNNSTYHLLVNRKTAKIIRGNQRGTPLIFYYDIPMKKLFHSEKPSKTFGDNRMPYFSNEFTGLKGTIHANLAKKNSDNIIVWYHKSSKKSYGPQFSWELNLYDEKGTKVGTIINDLTSGLLLDARFYQNGLGSITLLETNFPTGLNRWVLFYGVNSILILWGIFHLVRAKKHSEEWSSHWTYFPLKTTDIAKFFIRLLAFTVFDFAGIGILTGNIRILLVSDLIGLALLAYSIGWFAFPVVFKFIPWIPAFAVGAGGRHLDYIQYPFGVPLYFVGVTLFLLHKYLAHRADKERKFSNFLDQLPEVKREAILRELEREVEEKGNST